MLVRCPGKKMSELSSQHKPQCLLFVLLQPEWQSPRGHLAGHYGNNEPGLEPVRHLNADLGEGQMVPKIGGRMLTHHTFPQLLA